MKASRAPGPVSYVNLHQQRADKSIQGVNAKCGNQAIGASNRKSLAQNQGMHSSNNSSKVAKNRNHPTGNSPNGGILKKYRDIDEIPDSGWGEAVSFSDYSRNQSSYSRGEYGNSSVVESYSDDDYEVQVIEVKKAIKAVSINEAPPATIRSQAPRTSAGSEDDYSEPDELDFEENRRSEGRRKSTPGTSIVKQNVSRGPPPLPFPIATTKVQPIVLSPSNRKKDNYEIVSSKHVNATASPKKSIRIDQSHKQFSDDEAEEVDDFIDSPQSMFKSQPQNVKYSSSTTAKPVGKVMINTKLSEVNINAGKPPPPLPCDNIAPVSQAPVSPTLTDKEKLYYTKQPRNVEFKPYTLKQYQMIKPKEYVEIGKIKPDLNTDELIAKRKNAERIKEFSKQLRLVNKEAISEQPKLPAATEQNDMEIARQKYDSKRQKALDFARNIPKPKLVVAAGEESADHLSQAKSRRVPVDDYSDMAHHLQMDEDAQQAAKLQELEAKHALNKAKMEAIKKSLAL